jgi:hypothetical protein
VIFFKKKEEPVTARDIPKRVQNMARSDLVMWGDTLLLQAGASFDNWRYRSGDLDEVVLAADSFLSILEELRSRP